jgi:hypothetical protein
VFEGLCHTAQVAFTEVPDAEAGQIEALLLPYFFYCDIDFSHLSSVNIRRLQVALNSCTRCV